LTFDRQLASRPGNGFSKAAVKKLCIAILACSIGALLASLVPASSSGMPPRSGKPVMDLDSVFVPRSGPMPLHGAVVYKLTKGKWLRSDNWAGPVDPTDGDGGLPVILYTGGKDTSAMYSRDGDVPFVSDVEFDCAPWSYALASGGNLDATRFRIGGGGGLLFVQGATGVTRLSKVEQVDCSTGYFVKVGPSLPTRANPSGWTNEVVLEDIDAAEGSAEMALFRIDYCRRATLRNIRGSDTDANSAVRADGSRAVKNAVLRLHHVEQATVENCTFTGDVNLGAYDTTAETLSAKPADRAALAALRVRSMVFRNCVFDAGTFTINPGILQATFDHCSITVKSSAVVQCTLDGMLIQEPSRVTFTDCTLSSSASTKAPQAFGGKDARAWSRFTVLRTAITGRKAA
jgi:hypothetical protein